MCVCVRYKLSPSDVPDVFVESVESLVKRSTVLLELAADMWLVTGRKPLPLLIACVYVAWQSLKPMVSTLSHKLLKYHLLFKNERTHFHICPEDSYIHGTFQTEQI